MREMEGTVRRRESDKWQYLFTIRDPHGRKHQVSKGGFDTESKARYESLGVVGFGGWGSAVR